MRASFLEVGLVLLCWGPLCPAETPTWALYLPECASVMTQLGHPAWPPSAAFASVQPQHLQLSPGSGYPQTGELPQPCSLLASTSPSSKWAEECGSGGSEEPGTRDSGSSPGCVTGQGLLSLRASVLGSGARPACCVSSQGRGEVQRQPWIEKLSKLSSPMSPVGEDFFSSGSQAPGPGCVTLSRGLCFSGPSLPSTQ